VFEDFCFAEFESALNESAKALA
jgi:hypothetical protein